MKRLNPVDNIIQSAILGLIAMTLASVYYLSNNIDNINENGLFVTQQTVNSERYIRLLRILNSYNLDRDHRLLCIQVLNNFGPNLPSEHSWRDIIELIAGIGPEGPADQIRRFLGFNPGNYPPGAGGVIN